MSKDYSSANRVSVIQHSKLKGKLVADFHDLDVFLFNWKGVEAPYRLKEIMNGGSGLYIHDKESRKLWKRKCEGADDA